jgi:DNA-binding NtrC family response regulator
VLIASCVEHSLAELGNQVEVRFTRTTTETLEVLKVESFDLVFLDIMFAPGDMQGIHVISDIVQSHPQAKVVMLSNLDDDRTVLQCIQLGATDFVSKKGPGVKQLADIIRNHIASDMAHISDLTEGHRIAKLCGAVAQSQAMSEVFKQVALARRNLNIPVLIVGETGVGKEVIARAINVETGRTKVDVDCGAIPENLAESEFFGHKRGAFTGADTTKLGKFQLAHNGDLFLDEIGNLKRSLQDKFLRALQYKEITPLGGSVPQKVNVRIIAATNEHLERMVACGSFRQDLYERLKGIVIEIPPLRSRTEDIEPLVIGFIARSSKPYLTIATTCLNLLKGHSWRGNVRELEHVVNEMISAASGDQLTIAHLPLRFRSTLTTELSNSANIKNGEQNGVTRSYSVSLTGTLDQVVDQFLTSYLADRFSLLGERSTKTALARDLGIARNSLIQYVKRLNIGVLKRDL